VQFNDLEGLLGAFSIVPSSFPQIRRARNPASGLVELHMYLSSSSLIIYGLLYARNLNSFRSVYSMVYTYEYVYRFETLQKTDIIQLTRKEKAELQPFNTPSCREIPTVDFTLSVIL
jgi:hypothetical protein